MRKWLWKRVLPVVLVLALALPYPGTFASAAESESGSGTSGSTGAFGLPEASDLTEGSDEYKEAEANAPYGSTGNVVPLFVKSELYMTYGWSGTNRYSHIFDYNQNSTETGMTDFLTEGDTFEGLDNKYRTKFSAGGRGSVLTLDTAAVNAGSGKQEYVAVLGIGKGSSYLELRDKDDKLVSNTLELGGKAYLTDYAFELGGFAAVAAGDFDGDGVDSVVYYNPPTYGKSDGNICESTITKDTAGNPVLSGITAESKIIPDVYKHFGGSEYNTVAKDIPVVHLEAADVDKDGYDELIVTLGRNDVANSNALCGTQVLIYDKLASGWTLTANYAPTAATAGTNGAVGFVMNDYRAAAQAKRYVWSTSSVGNVIVSDDSATGTDFPEIVTAGWVDMYGSGKDIELDEKTLGVTVVRCTGMTEGHTGQKNYQGKYELVYSSTLEANSWTQAGCYDEDDRNSLLQVKCFSYLGGAQAEAIFLSGTVYTWSDGDGDGSLQSAYTYKYYTGGDNYIGSTKITNKQIQSVAVGNFDGNAEGREQVVFANLVKKSGGTSHYVSFYVYGCDQVSGSNEWRGSEVDGWPISGKDGAYVSLTDFDCDNDGVLVQYTGVRRTWEDCDILAILEPQPYFAELGDDLGEGHTAYGKSSTTGSGSGSSHGFSIGVVTGYEAGIGQIGGVGMEMSIENNFTWSTNVSRTEEHSITYENQTGENIVVVYRVPVLVYTYVNVANGKEMVVAKTLPPETASVTVEEYNEQAEAYKMSVIDESKLVTAGDPFSYPSNTNQITNAGGTNVTISKTGWSVLSGTNTEKSISFSTESENAFEYELDVDISVWCTALGFKGGYSGGYSYTHSSTTLNGTGTEYSGSVMGPVAEGYSFKWNFAMWNMEVGGKKVPVLGYLVSDAAAPASPPTDVDVQYDTLTSTSATLTWTAGSRPAAEYRIYRVMNDGSYAYLTSVSGDETECSVSGLGQNMTYTFVVRAYDDGAESVDSESITFTTPKTGGTSYVTLGEIGGQNDLTAGGSTTFSVVVIKNDRTALLAMQWQKRDPGSGKWEDIEGANSNTLSITNAKLTQDGTKYRLRVSVRALQEEVSVYYYSKPVTLNVGSLNTDVYISSVTNSESLWTEAEGMGSAPNDPYIGYSDWLLAGTAQSEVTRDVSVRFMNGESEAGSVYSYSPEGGTPLYIGVASLTDSEGKATGETAYYALTGDATSGFTQESKLTVYYKTADDALIEAATYSVDQITCEDASKEAYNAVASYSEGGTPARYWEKGGKYYAGEADGAMTETEPASAPNYAVCYQSDAVYVLRALSEEGGLSESFILLNGSTAQSFTAEEYLQIDGTLYRVTDFAALTKEETATVEIPTTTAESGTELTLKARAWASGSNEISEQSAFFLITNTADGTSYRIEATTDSYGNFKGTWTAPTAGLYAIRAGVNASVNYSAASSAPVYYAAVQKDTKGDAQPMSYLAAHIGDADGSYAADSVAYGTALYFEQYTVSDAGSTPTLTSVTAGTVTLPTTGSDGKKEQTTLDSSTYAPDRAGQYVVGSDGSELIFTVTPKKLTVKPTLDKTVPDTVGDFTLTFTGALESDEASLQSVLSVNDENGYFDKSSGAFTFAPAWSEAETNAAEVQRLRSAYSVTLESVTLRRELGKIPVAYQTEANAHGTLYGFYGDSMTSFVSGTDMAEGTKLIFQANPDEGYSVTDWKVNGAGFSSSDLYYQLGYSESGQETLTINSLDITGLDSLTVSVGFSAKGATVSFSVEEGEGTLSAKTAAGTEIISGTYLSYGSSVTVTATPAENYMVGGWEINWEPYCWPGTELPYQETTLTLSELGSTTNNWYNVQVKFVEKKTVQVVAPSMVQTVVTSYDPYTEEKQTVALGSISVADASGTAVAAGSNVVQGTVLTYTAAFNDASFNYVEYWEYSTDGGTSWTKGGSGASFTLYTSELTLGTDASLQVRAVIVATVGKYLSYKLDISALIDAGVATEEDAWSTDFVTVTAKSGDVELEIGKSYPVGTPVTFELKTDPSYQATWSGCDVKASKDGLSATMVIPANVSDYDPLVTIALSLKTVTPTEGILVEPTLPTGSTDTVNVTVAGGGFYTDGVTDNVITVNATVACVVIVATTDENGNVTYKRLTANAVDVEAGTYRFNTVLELGEKVITAIKGDMPINGQTDGKIDGLDIVQIKRAARQSSWTESDRAWMDIFGDDGKVDGLDILMLKRAAKGTTKLSW